MKFLLLLMAMFAVSALALTDTQTDWFGGEGVPGPVTSWGDTYSTSTGIDSLFIPGQLTLSADSIALEKNVVGAILTGYGSPTADLDGDGDLDMIHAEYYSNKFRWSENVDGTGTSWIQHDLVDYPWASNIHPCDFDGDGDIDVIGASGKDSLSGVSWFENLDGLGTSWSIHSIDDYYYETWALSAGDLDGDGDMDVLGCSRDRSNIRWWENTDGTGTTWTCHSVFEGYSGASDVRAVDMDNDDDLDVLAASYYGNYASWMENDGTGSGWTEHIVGTLDRTNCTNPVDFDEDGDIDVVVAAAWGGTAWWENTNGSGTAWTEHNCGQSAGTICAYSGDFDGDHDLDIIIAMSSGEIGWNENTDDSGTSWAYHYIDHYYPTLNIQVADIDGDGRLDIVGSSVYYPSDVSWWKFLGYASSGELYSSILDTECSPLWGDISWTDSLSDGTELSVELRAGSTPGTMGDWLTIPEPSPIPAYLDNLPYLQYRITMSTSGSFIPTLQDITVDWEPYTGTADTHEDEIPTWGFAPLENPSQGGTLILNLSAATAGPVKLRVYDLSGRIMTETTVTAVTGTQEILFEGLPQGVCFCTMEADGFTATQRVVVIP